MDEFIRNMTTYENKNHENKVGRNKKEKNQLLKAIKTIEQADKNLVLVTRRVQHIFTKERH